MKSVTSARSKIGKLRRTLSLMAGIFLALALGLVLPDFVGLRVPPAGAQVQTATFSSPGTTTWTVPPGVTEITVATWGGDGAYSRTESFAVTQGQNLTDYMLYFGDVRDDANWQGATKGYTGEVEDYLV